MITLTWTMWVLLHGLQWHKFGHIPVSLQISSLLNFPSKLFEMNSKLFVVILISGTFSILVFHISQFINERTFLRVFIIVTICGLHQLSVLHIMLISILNFFLSTVHSCDVKHTCSSCGKGLEYHNKNKFLVKLLDVQWRKSRLWSFW